MSDEQLPTLEQIEAQIPQVLQRIGIMDAEWRKVAEPFTELQGRLQQIEAEKAELHKMLVNLQGTREHILGQQAGEGGSDDDSSEA